MMRRRPTHFLRLLALALFLPLLWQPWAYAVEIHIDSPSFSYDQSSKTYIYKDARIRVGELTIDAETVEIQTETGYIQATGWVRFQEGRITGAARRMVFDSQKESGVIYEAKLFDAGNGYYLAAEKILRNPQEGFMAVNCSMTNCPPSQGGWRLEAGEINYHSKRFATSTNTTLKLGGVPVVWSPIMAWPTVMERHTGFLVPNLGYQSSSLRRLNLGGTFNIPFFWAIDEDHDLTLIPKIIENRGVGLAAEYNYAFVPDQKGQLRGWAINEGRLRHLEDENPGDGGLPTQDRFTPHRYLYNWGHNQALGPETRLVATAEGGSDGQVWLEYDQKLDYRPQRIYQLSLTHQYRNGNIGLTGQHASEFKEESIFATLEEHVDGAQQPVVKPRFSYAVSGRPGLGNLALFMEGASTDFFTQTGASGQNHYLRPGLTLPLPLGSSLELRLTGAKKIYSYTNLWLTDPALDTTALNPTGEATTFGQGEAQVELLFPLARVYEGTGVWSEYKHLLIPRLQFYYLEDVAQPLTSVLHRAYPTARLAVFQLDNDFFGRSRENGRVQQLASLRLIQRYDYLKVNPNYAPSGPALPTPSETQPGQPLLPAILEGSLNAWGLTTNMAIHYHHQLGRVTQTSIGLSGATRRNDSLAVNFYRNEYAYRSALEDNLSPEGAGITFNGLITASENVSFGFNTLFNLLNEPAPLNRRVSNGTLFLDYHPTCYAVRLTYDEKINLTQQDQQNIYYLDRRVVLSFQLGGLSTPDQALSIPGISQ